jgi:hypothetical protein
VPDDKLLPGPGLTDADSETVEIVEREMAELADDAHIAIEAAGGPLSDVANNPARLEKRIDAVVLRLAERICARPRPVAFNRCAVFVAVTRDGAGRMGLIPALVRSDKLQAGFQALLGAAEKHGSVVATLSILTEPNVAQRSRVAMAGRFDHRGMFRQWARGVLRADGSAKLGAWGEAKSAAFTGWGGEKIAAPEPKDLLN